MGQVDDFVFRSEAERTPLRVVEAEPEEEMKPSPRRSPGSRSVFASGSMPFAFEDLLACCAPSTWVPDATALLFLSNNSHAGAAEEVRGIRSRLYHLKETKPTKKLLVTSTVAQEGKSFIASNLAHALMLQGCKVLLIDANLRSPSLHSIFGTYATPGLSEYLRDLVDPPTVMQRGESENLFLIPAGEPASGPTELIGNGRFGVLLDLLGAAFDWIVVDSPPALPFSDSELLAGNCDAVVMVVRANSTSLELTRAACRKFRDGQMAGIVLNGASPSVLY